MERTLGIRDAMSRLALSRPRVKQLAAAGRIGKLVAGRYLFSAQELRAFSRLPRKAGRPKSL
jgi:hypothetical protein